MMKKCVVNNCKNTNDTSQFYGDLCSQCHAFIRAGIINESQAYKNAISINLRNNPVVMIESPYRDGDRAKNLRYLAWCEYHSFMLGEFPISSHGNCTAYLPEDDKHRAKGFAWRNIVRRMCGRVVYYIDLGMSDGVKKAMSIDVANGVPYEMRSLPYELLTAFKNGEEAPGSMSRQPK